MSVPKIAFHLRAVSIELTKILPVRKLDPDKVRRYRTILSSIREVGLVEPLVVYPHKTDSDTYLLLDGHFRFYALKEIGSAEASCIIATDDESFTYNARVNRLAPIQEHQMIVKAVQNGVSPKKIAAALNRPEAEVFAMLNLLEGIDPEAAELLKDKVMSPKAIRLLRKVTPFRQTEMAELMISSNNFTFGYAEALFIGTSRDQLLEPQKKAKKGLTREEVARMEGEMISIKRDLDEVEQAYSENTLHLTFIRGYIKKLLENAKVTRFLSTKHPDMFSEFESIAAMEAL